MKINDIKHNHSLTDLLKVSIFSILMCAPLIAIGSTCAYAIVNKNAYQSYSGNETINKYQLANDIQVDGKYRLIPAQYTTTQNINFSFNNLGVGADLSFKSYLEDARTIYLRTDGTIVFYNAANSYIYEIAWDANSWYIDIELTNFSPNTQATQDTLKSVLNVPVNNNKYIDNAFYYATEKMTQSDLFNWTENTAIYTGVSAMCTQLDIETNVIPILIVYWFILTIIYVIIDIVLKTFTTLTHMLSKETH